MKLTPNENLQGWSPATILSHTQRAFLFEAGVEEGMFPVDIPDWSYNKRLMTAVSIELENLQHVAPGDSPTSDIESQGQLTFSVPECMRPRVEKLLDFEGRSNTAIVGPISMMGIRHMYRVRHTTLDNNKNWSVCWSRDHMFDAVPNGWIPTINHLRILEYEEINIPRFNTEFFGPTDFIRNIVHKDNEQLVRKK